MGRSLETDFVAHNPLASEREENTLWFVELEWDPRKAEQNFRKHGVSFTEAATVLEDSLSETVYEEG